MATLEFQQRLKLPELGIELRAVGDDRGIEHAGTQRPDILIPFNGPAVGIGPGVAHVIEGSGVDQGPIQKIIERVMGVAIVVEDVRYAELADGDDQPIRCVGASKLVEARRGFLNVAAQIDGLANKHA